MGDLSEQFESGERFALNIPGLSYPLHLPWVWLPGDEQDVRIASLNLIGQVRWNLDVGKLLAARVRSAFPEVSQLCLMTVVEKALQLAQVVASELGMADMAVAYNRVKPHMEASGRPVIQVGADSITSGVKYLALYERDINLLTRRASGGVVLIDDVVTTGGTVLGLVDLLVQPRARIDELSLGQQQRVEILKLLHRNVDLLILDEPTAVLTPAEVEGLFATLRRIVREGRSVVFITHKLEEVMEIADRITVLRRGRRVADLTPAEVDSRRELARLMVGREVVLSVQREPVPPGDAVLELRDCSGYDARGHRAFRRVSFAVRRGEVFAIVGVAGNGQTELVSAITGAGRFSSGQMLLFGKRLGSAGRPSTEAVGYIPEDRTGTGSVPGLDLTENLLLTTYHRFCRRGLLRKEAARRMTEEVLARFHVAAPGPHALGRQLSGGNMQKLILARELSKQPQLIIAEHPTHGLDIGATVEVWEELLRQRTRAGILLVSGDLTEVLALSDRIAVIFRGELMDTFSAADPDAIAEIGPMMAGVRHE